MILRFALVLLVIAPALAQTNWENPKRSIVQLINSSNTVVGAGFVVGTGDGTVYILTARHVLDDAPTQVRFYERQADTFDFEVGPTSDSTLDLAILVVRSTQSKPVPTAFTRFEAGDPQKVVVDQKVTAIGHPASAAWLPALNNEILDDKHGADFRKFRFKRVSIDGGNSGGPIFFSDGKLAGVVQEVAGAYAIGFRIWEARRVVRDGWKLPVNYLQTEADLHLQKGREAYNASNYAAALSAFQAAAKKDEPEAMGYLCMMYRLGQGTTGRDPRQALSFCQRAAQSGDARGMHGLAILYETRVAPSQNAMADAAASYKKAAEWGYALAMLRFSKLLENGDGVAKDLKAAIGWLERAADLGNGEAANDLGIRYDHGSGVPRDYVRAATFFQKGDKAGNLTATANLGLYYESGIGGLPRDPAQAFQLYKKSAEGGNSWGMYRLALAHDKGIGVPKSALALVWYVKSADKGQAEAQMEWARHLFAFSEQQTDKKKRAIQEVQAFGYLSKAAAANLPDALYEVSLAHRTGRGTPINITAADAARAKAAAAGHRQARFEEGKAASDPATGLKWIVQAAEQGHVDAMLEAGLRLWNATPPDYVRAVSWFEKAAARDNAAATYNMGIAWDTGRGVAKADRTTACGWFRKAAEKSFGLAMVAYGECIASPDPSKAYELFVAAARLKVDGAREKAAQLRPRVFGSSLEIPGVGAIPVERVDLNPGAASEKLPLTIGQDPKAPEITLFFYGRPGLDFKPSVFLDNIELARIRGEGWFAVRTRVGRHTVCFESYGKNCAAAELSEQRSYYIRVDNKGLGYKAVMIVPEDGAARVRELERIDSDLFKSPKYIFFPNP